MEASLLYDLIDMRKLLDYREELMKDENDVLFKDEREAREKLEKALSKEQMKLVDSYKHYIGMREGYVNYQLGIKVLNYGVKIGMELQKAFDDEEP
ncbi:MAG: hypothetical protein K2O41_01970 [Clostridia bacterium]|nr:hypothetical protein [Clostridia bacterium]